MSGLGRLCVVSRPSWGTCFPCAFEEHRSRLRLCLRTAVGLRFGVTKPRFTHQWWPGREYTLIAVLSSPMTTPNYSNKLVDKSFTGRKADWPEWSVIFLDAADGKGDEEHSWKDCFEGTDRQVGLTLSLHSRRFPKRKFHFPKRHRHPCSCRRRHAPYLMTTSRAEMLLGRVRPIPSSNATAARTS